jgi:hypothetical protein
MRDLYQTSRHLWLGQQGERFLVTNLLTGRRALLSTAELEELETFCTPSALNEANPTHQRLLDADLLLIEGRSTANTPRLEALEKALHKFLAERLETSRRKVREQFLSIEDGLAEAEKFLIHDLAHSRGVSSHSRGVANKDLKVLVDHVRTFLDLELTGDFTFSYAKGLLSESAGRPLPREDYEQQPCLPETSQRRIEKARPHLSDDSRCLILGDDDLLSLYWSRWVENPCDVFELDEELIQFLSPRLAGHVKLHPRDLTEGLPDEFRGRYHLIFTDPMYERTGMDLFLKCCSTGLSDNPRARVFFTTRPDMIEDGEQLEQRMANVGLSIEEKYLNFSRYRLPDFYRRKLIRGFHQAGISPQIVQGFCQIPFLYADLFVLKRRV